MPSCVKSQASYAHLYISKSACWLMEGLCYKFYYSICQVYVQLKFWGVDGLFSVWAFWVNCFFLCNVVGPPKRSLPQAGHNSDFRSTFRAGPSDHPTGHCHLHPPSQVLDQPKSWMQEL